ncbi:hypothetical protein ABZP36_020687 [Zizania latifolia]
MTGGAPRGAGEWWRSRRRPEWVSTARVGGIRWRRCSERCSLSAISARKKKKKKETGAPRAAILGAICFPAAARHRRVAGGSSLTIGELAGFMLDFPSDPPFFTLNIDRLLSEKSDGTHQSFSDEFEQARHKIRAKCRKFLKGSGKDQMTLYLTPEENYVFTVVFAAGNSTVSPIIEANNMWVRGFRTSEEVIYEFKDDSPKFVDQYKTDECKTKRQQKHKKEHRGKPNKLPCKFIKDSILLDHGRQRYVLNWDKYSGYILKSLDVPLSIWNANEDYNRSNESFFFKEDVYIDLKTIVQDVLLIKCDSYASSSLRRVEGTLIHLPTALKSTFGVVLIDRVTAVLPRGMDIPCASEITVKSFISSPIIQIVERDFPIFTDEHSEASQIKMNLEPTQGSREIKVMLYAHAFELSVVVCQIGHEGTTKRDEYCYRLSLDDEKFRRHSELCVKYRDTFQSLKAEKAEMAINQYPGFSETDLICGTKQKALILQGKMPHVEIRKLGSTGSVQDVSVQKEQLHVGPYEDAAQLACDSLSNARRSLDSAFKVDSAEGHIVRSTEAETGLNIYAYGISELTALQAIKQLELEDIVTVTIAEIRKLGSTGSVQNVSVQKEQLHVGPYEDAAQLACDSLSNARRSLDSAFNLDSAEGHIFVTYWIGYSRSQSSTALQAIKQLELEDIVTLTYNISEADAVIALQSKLKKNTKIQAVLISQDIQVFLTKTNSLVQIRRALGSLVDDHTDGLIDFEDKEEVRSSEETDALEVDLVESFKLEWEAIGQEPNACLRILPQFVGMEEGSMTVKQEATTGLTDSESSDDMHYTQNGIRRLPFLPDYLIFSSLPTVAVPCCIFHSSSTTLGCY